MVPQELAGSRFLASWLRSPADPAFAGRSPFSLINSNSDQRPFFPDVSEIRKGTLC